MLGRSAGARLGRALVFSCLAALGTAQAQPFSFVALGDTAYEGEADDARYEALIQRINQARPAFTIHVGDIWGATACQDADHRRILGWFARYDHPLIYTPGDNEWTDCLDPQVLAAWERLEEKRPQPGDEAMLADFQRLESRARRPGRWALESLARIRSLYFPSAQSLGGRTIALQRQAAEPGPYAQMVENARWAQGEVLFATLHVVGSMNSLTIASSEAAAEAVQRNQANLAWLQQTFDEAVRTQAKAVVLALHASFLDKAPPTGTNLGRSVRGGRHGPYGLIAAAIQDGSARFGKPVLLIHGDDHEFSIDRPFLAKDDKTQGLKGANLTRLQVYGAPEIRAVRVGVDTGTPWVFSFTPLFAE